RSTQSAAPSTPPCALPHRYKTFSSKVQYQLVVTTLHKLQESGFYWGSINGKEANAMLAAESVGTFLIRDSSDNRHFFFTLSVKTASGTKNLRIQCDSGPSYSNGPQEHAGCAPLRLCAEAGPPLHAPDQGASLVEKNTRGGNASYYIYSGGEKIPLELLKPFSSTMSSLQHRVGKQSTDTWTYPANGTSFPTLKEFLQEYDAPI
uniref:Suppressor of cytokine signaling 3 n=1 Tax=Oncorhynchus kisutch TaxID=8019 RepID=A0A8C7JYT7_ONCKI